MSSSRQAYPLMVNDSIAKVLKNEESELGSVYFLLFAAFILYPHLDALTVDSLRAPMQDLKKEVFSWMFAIKIASAAVGGAFSLAKQSLTPFGVGAGIAAGIHFFDKWLGDGSAALIG